MLQAQPKITVTSALYEKDEITIGTSTSAAFTAELNAHFPGAARSSIHAILPYSIVVTNNGPSPISSLTLRHELYSRAGTMISWTFTYHSFGSGREAFDVHSHASALLFPVSSISKMLLEKRLDLAKLNLPDVHIRMNDMLATLSTQESVTISVDSIIFRDGTLLGPDKANVLTMFNDSKGGQNDLVVEFTLRKTAGASDAVLLEWLSAEQNNAQGPGAKSDAYIERRKMIARSIANVIKAKGSEGVLQIIDGS